MATQTPDNNITSANLAPTVSTVVTDPPVDTTNHNAITSSVTKSVMDQYAGLNAKQDQAQTDQNDLSKSISALIGSEGGKAADTQAANTASGVDTAKADQDKYTSQLADLNAQASSLNREAQAIPLQTQENNRNTGATDAGVAPQNAGALRQNALKALSIGQQADIASAALTGSSIRLQAAKDKAQQIVDLKYKPMEAELAAKQAQYNLNKDALDSLDKKRSEALQVSLKKEADDLAEKKAQESKKQDLLITASAQGVSAAKIAQAQDAATPEDAARILGVSPLTQLDAESKIQSIAASKASVAKIYSDIAVANAKLVADGNALNFKTPPILNPQTGRLDPATQLATVIAGTGTKDNANLQAIGGVVSALQKFAYDNPDGDFPGIGLVRPGKLTIGPKGTDNQTSLQGINLKVQQWASGASLTKQQTDQVNQLTPQKSDTARVAKEKINALTNFMLSQAQGLLTTQGIKYTPSPVDFFNGTNLNTVSNNDFLATIPSTASDTLTNNKSFYNQ